MDTDESPSTEDPFSTRQEREGADADEQTDAPRFDFAPLAAMLGALVAPVLTTGLIGGAGLLPLLAQDNALFSAAAWVVLTALVLLLWITWAHSSRLARRLQTEANAVDAVYEEASLAVREIQLAAANATAAAGHGPSPATLETRALDAIAGEDTIATQVLGDIADRFAAGGEPDLDSVASVVDAEIDARLSPVSRAIELAVVIGLIGTVMGLGLQMFVADLSDTRSLVGGGILTGGVLATITTGAGILVSLYARARRAGLADGYGSLGQELTRVVARTVLPGCDPSVRVVAGVTEALNQVVDRFEHSHTTLKETLREGMRSGFQSGAKEMRSLLSKEIAPAVRDTISDPIKAVLKSLDTRVSIADKAVREAIVNLEKSVENTGKSLTDSTSSQKNLAATVKQLDGVVSGIVATFGTVAEAARAAAGELKAASGEVNAAVAAIHAEEPLVAQASESLAHLIQQNEELTRQLQTAMANLSRLFEQSLEAGYRNGDADHGSSG